MRDFSGSKEVEVFTLSDLVHRMTLRVSGEPTKRAQAMYVRAIQDAIRSLPSKADWTYYMRQARFTASPTQGMTIAYDHTGGTEERLVTITSGDAWPADATYGEIRVGENTYRVGRRLNDVQVTLEDDFSLRSDFVGDVTWERRAYQFSRELTKVHYVKNLTVDRIVPYLPVSDFMESVDTMWGQGSPDVFTWMNHGNTFGSPEFVLLPAPLRNDIYEVSATVSPLIPKINIVGGPDLVCASGSSTVTSDTNTFTSKLVGCVMRISGDGTPPIDFDGENYDFQAFVTEVVDDSTLKLSESVPFSGERGYAMSSPIEVDAAVMLEHLEDEAYHQYTKNHDHKSIQQAKMNARESLIMALSRNNKVSLNSRMWSSYGDSGWWNSGAFYTVVDTLEAQSFTPSPYAYELGFLPDNGVGRDGDTLTITSGGLSGNEYTKIDGVWTLQ